MTKNIGQERRDHECETVGQGHFRYRADLDWGRLERLQYPVKDCHGIQADRDGRIVMLCNDTRNNFIAYSQEGDFMTAWGSRFPGAHGLDICVRDGEETYWITDHEQQALFVCDPEGRELWSLNAAAVSHLYPDPTKYRPTNSAVLPDGRIFVSDGYGASYVHCFDPDGVHIRSFGGEGDAPECLATPHAVWIDTRSGSPLLLVCDRAHETLKWFSPSGELVRMVRLPGALPSNVTALKEPYGDHLAIASLNGMVLILDGSDRVVSVIGGESPIYTNGNLEPLSAYNQVFNHPHDIYADQSNSLYVVQWWSNQTYPIKLDLMA